MSEHLSKEEQLYVKRLARCIKDKPSGLKIYGASSGLYVCKDGVNSDDLTCPVGAIEETGIAVSEMHDFSEEFGS
jgi:hypothetical protein